MPSDQLGPGDAPSRYVTMPPPALSDEFDARGIVTDGSELAVYPTSADEATDGTLNPNTWLNLTGAVDGEDGTRWYRTDTGDFVPADAVFIPERIEVGRIALAAHFGANQIFVRSVLVPVDGISHLAQIAA